MNRLEICYFFRFNIYFSQEKPNLNKNEHFFLRIIKKNVGLFIKFFNFFRKYDASI